MGEVPEEAVRCLFGYIRILKNVPTFSATPLEKKKDILSLVFREI